MMRAQHWVKIGRGRLQPPKHPLDLSPLEAGKLICSESKLIYMQEEISALPL